MLGEARSTEPHPILWPRLKELLKFSVGMAALKTNDYDFEFETKEEGKERS